jgi:hypothetical protein
MAALILSLYAITTPAILMMPPSTTHYRTSMA